jgi:RNA polymerase sigma factor (sigma-70 family)
METLDIQQLAFVPAFTLQPPPFDTIDIPPIEIRPIVFAEDRQPALRALPPAGGNETLFRDLVKEYGASLYYFVLKRVKHPDDAADIAQQAFVEAACSLTSFRGEAELSTWLFGIATNLSRNHVSRAPQNRHRFESDDVLEECESAELDPGESLSQRQGLQLVTEAMRRLPPEMAAALDLVAVQELSYEEAANQLRIPVGTVRSRVSRARAAVREHLRSVGYCTAAA